MAGVLLFFATYGTILLLHLIVPGRWVEGYLPMRYRLNGLRVLFLCVVLYVSVCVQRLMPWDVYWVYRWEMLACAFVVGIVFSVAILIGAPKRKAWPIDFFLGRRENPRTQSGFFDTKMFLYLIGAVMLELNVLSFGAHHVMMHPDNPSPGVLLYAAMFSFFVSEYLFFERVHLYTYDIFAERVGFKLGWGCLVFYPFFYPIGLFATAELSNPETPTWVLALSLVIFFSGWSLARGANLQKFVFKRDPTRPFLGITPVATEGRVLASGYWGVSRHVNYLGELLMATGLALVLGGHSVLPWLYPLYYMLLLVPRERDDDKRCAEKYGTTWDEYRRRVRWRIVPFIY